MIVYGKSKQFSTLWWPTLVKHALLTFTISKPSFVGGNDSSGQNGDVRWGLQAFFCSFNYAGRFKNKRRPEKFFSISGVGLPVDDGTAELELVPFCPSRVSPFAQFQRPARSDDTCAGTPSFPTYTGLYPHLR